jgi:glycosyltransferase involved in cell wall biosynthesis
MQPTAPRILIVTEHASLKMGGEAARPFHYFRFMRARGIEVWLVTHERCKDELTKLAGENADRLYFAPDTAWQKRLNRWGRPLPASVRLVTTEALIHMITQKHQKRIVKQLVKEKQIDIVHEPIPISPKQPSSTYNVGAPVVIGPLNGNINYPPAFSYMERGIKRYAIGFTRFISGALNWLIPGKRRAAAILVSNQRTHDALPKGVTGKVIHLTANAVDLSTWEQRQPRVPGPRARFVFLGRLVDFKMVDLLLEAFAPLAKHHNAELEIIGEGEDRAKLEAQAKSLGIEKNVTFMGWMANKASAERLAMADALVFPSLRECGGAVVMEAMAVGLPVIAADWGGPADYVGDDGAGVLVKPQTREQFVVDLRAEMKKLIDDPSRVTEMSRRALNRAQTQFQWQHRIDRLLEVYAQVLSQRDA